MRRLTSVAAWSLLAAACHSQVPAASTPGSKAGGFCRPVARMSCEVPMSAATPEELCRQLKACTEDRDIPGDLLKDVAFCRPLAGKVDVHAGSISSFAAMDAVVTNDYERQLDAVYLVAKYNTGFCIVDELLEPVLTPNGCTSKFELHFDSSTQLSIQIERTCLDTRDAQELAEGESNIYSIDCFDQRYAVEGDNVKRVHEAARVGPCKH